MGAAPAAFDPSYFQLPVQQFDNNGNPINPGTQPGTGALPPSPALDPTRNDSIGAQVNANQNYITQGASAIDQTANQGLQYWDPLTSQYVSATNQALNNLAQTPGYTAPEASQINTNYSQFNTSPDALNAQYLTPAEQQEVYGNPYAAKTGVDQGTAAEGQALNDYQSNLSGQLQNYGTDLSGNTQNFQTGTMTAAGQLQSGLQNAQSGFSKLDSAVSNPNLAFDPNSTEQQMTNQDVQNIKTAAGARIGNQYQTAEDQLRRDAAAAGNASPLAIAAGNARLQHQEASDQGNSELNADIAARQAQYDRAASIEAQREQNAFGGAGLKANAATTEQSQAQAAAGLGGQANLSAAEAAGQAGINAANQYGQANINAANTYGQQAQNTLSNITNQQYGANTAADNASTSRAAQIAGNRQQTLGNINTTAYNQGVGSAQATSAGAQAVGNARMAGQGAYRAGLANQQSASQTGAQNASTNKQAALGTAATGLSQGTQTLSNYKSSSPTLTGQATGLINAILDEGAIATQPTEAIVGERGPEEIVKLGQSRYRRMVA